MPVFNIRIGYALDELKTASAILVEISSLKHHPKLTTCQEAINNACRILKNQVDLSTGMTTNQRQTLVKVARIATTNSVVFSKEAEAVLDTLEKSPVTRELVNCLKQFFEQYKGLRFRCICGQPARLCWHQDNRLNYYACGGYMTYSHPIASSKRFVQHGSHTTLPRLKLITAGA